MFSQTRIRKLSFMGSSRKNIRRFPKEVREDFGHALFEVQLGSKPAAAKPLQGFGGAGVLEIVENDDGGT